MKFSDFILTDAIITDLKAKSKDEVILEMVTALSKANGIPQADIVGVADSIKRREELGSTGIGHGVAVPHTKHVSVDRLVGAVAVSRREGVDFDSLDCEPVNLIFMLVSPPDRPGEHLRALEHITHQLKDDGFVRFLKQAQTVEDVLELLNEADGAASA
jgi:mannitol/fructose-specific phosphotransferase system IIA component (Ntr-type)